MEKWQNQWILKLARVDIAIVGPNGGGKIHVGGYHYLPSSSSVKGPSIRLQSKSKEMISDNIKYITFRDSYGGDNDKAYYLQQRWNQQEIDENTPTVERPLRKRSKWQVKTHQNGDACKNTCTSCSILRLCSTNISYYYRWRTAQIQLTKVLLSDPRVLIMDNPFIGLDATTRDQLKALLKTLSQERALQIILVLSKEDDISDFITHIVEVRNMKVMPKCFKEDYISQRKPFPTRILTQEKKIQY